MDGRRESKALQIKAFRTLRRIESAEVHRLGPETVLTYTQYHPSLSHLDEPLLIHQSTTIVPQFE